MNILYSKKFLKDIEQINDKKLLNSISDIIDKIRPLQSMNEFPGLRKMVGYDNYYRIRTGNYRLGVKLENDIITLLRFKHRKDIYEVFP